MYKTASRLILLLVLFMSIDSGITKKYDSEKVLAGINIVEYEKILHVYGPLDRLYCSGDICYFILPKYEIDAMMNDGFKIDSIHGKKIRHSNDLLRY